MVSRERFGWDPMQLRTVMAGVVSTGTVAFGFALWLMLQPASAGTMVWVSNICQFAGPFVMLLLFGWQALALLTRPDRPTLGRAFWAPVVLGLGVASWLVGQLIWIVNEEILHVSLFPAWSDIGFLGLYPFLFLAIFLLPGRRSSTLGRFQLALDGLVLTTVAITFSWYFLIGPTVYDRSASILAVIVSSLYPAFDLVLVACVFVLWIRSDEPSARRSLQLLSVALVATVATDSIFQYQQIRGTYHTGTLLDAGWTVAYMMMVLSAQLLLAGFANRATHTTTVSRIPSDMKRPFILWIEYLPYIALPIMAGFFLTLWNTPGDGDDYLEPGVALGCIVVAGLIILRQFVAIRDNQQLHRALQREGLVLDATNHELIASNRALEAANLRLESLVTTDPLTNLLNHRAIMSAFDQEVERARRFGRIFSVLFIDLDHFKAINDSYGHAAGDTTLKEFAGLIRIGLRGVDVLGRWGGEEFLAILPEIGVDEAAACAERIRETVASFRFSVGGGSHLTCSIGVASYPVHADSRGLLIELADHAMYAAKHLGRNQVRRADEPGVAALLLGIGVAAEREETTLVGVVEALAAIVQARDRYTGQHTADVGRQVSQLALKLGFSAEEARMLGLAGLLHDIGKVGIPDAILQKAAQLTIDEWDVMYQHPIIGADVVSRVPALRSLVPIIRGHHERWDGMGYPDGLAAEEIPLGARIVAVVDAFFAIISDRPYRKSQSYDWARVELSRCAGTQFDPSLVVALLEMLNGNDAVVTLPVDLPLVSGSMRV